MNQSMKRRVVNMERANQILHSIRFMESLLDLAKTSEDKDFLIEMLFDLQKILNESRRDL